MSQTCACQTLDQQKNLYLRPSLFGSWYLYWFPGQLSISYFTSFLNLLCSLNAAVRNLFVGYIVFLLLIYIPKIDVHAYPAKKKMCFNIQLRTNFIIPSPLWKKPGKSDFSSPRTSIYYTDIPHLPFFNYKVDINMPWCCICAAVYCSLCK